MTGRLQSGHQRGHAHNRPAIQSRINDRAFAWLADAATLVPNERFLSVEQRNLVVGSCGWTCDARRSSELFPADHPGDPMVRTLAHLWSSRRRFAELHDAQDPIELQIGVLAVFLVTPRLGKLVISRGSFEVDDWSVRAAAEELNQARVHFLENEREVGGVPRVTNSELLVVQADAVNAARVLLRAMPQDIA